MIDCNVIERILLKYVYGNVFCISSKESCKNKPPLTRTLSRKGRGYRDDSPSLDGRGEGEGGLRAFTDDLKLLAESTSRLSRLFTKERANLPSDYLKDKNLRNAYILYFLQANLYKIHVPLRELAKHPANLFLKDRLRVLDIGSGPGTAILGILDFFAGYEKKPFLEFVAVDSVAENLRDAEGLFRLYMDEIPHPHPDPLPEGEGAKFIPSPSRGGVGRGWGLFSDAHYSGGSLATVKSIIEKIKKLPSGPFDIIVLSNLLSEVAHNDPDRIVKRVRLLKNLLNDFMSDTGSCIIIEPALRETSREMLQVRDGILEEGFNIFSPCFMNKHCTALNNPKDWCHEDISWNASELIKKIDKLTGLKKDSIKFSYMVLRKDKKSLADLHSEQKQKQEAPPPLNPLPQGEGRLDKQLTERGQGEFLNSLPFKGRVRVGMGLFSDEYISRIVSEPLITKGKIEFYVCGSNGRNLIVRLDKDRSPLNKGFDEMKRGDVVLCKGVIVEEKRLKVNKETEIEILERHRLNI